jgi:hypothetical protein
MMDVNSTFYHLFLLLVKENVKVLKCQALFNQESNCEEDNN